MLCVDGYTVYQSKGHKYVTEADVTPRQIFWFLPSIIHNNDSRGQWWNKKSRLVSLIDNYMAGTLGIADYN